MSSNTKVLKVSWRINYKTGYGNKEQVFRRKENGTIVSIDCLDTKPKVWGRVKLDGIGTDILTCHMWTSGFVGTAQTTLTCELVVRDN